MEIYVVGEGTWELEDGEMFDGVSFVGSRIPQGLKPGGAEDSMSDLKVRPPKEGRKSRRGNNIVFVGRLTG